MGIYSRDYLRETPPPQYGGGASFRGGGQPWAIKYLLIANIGVFLLQYATMKPVPVHTVQIVNGTEVVRQVIVYVSPVQTWLDLSWESLRQFQIWRLVSYGFCHGGIQHILFNLFGLWIFGRLLEPLYGSREFLAFYLCAVVAGGVGHLLVGFLMPGPALPVIGASGGVVGVVILTALCFPRMTVLLMMVIPIQMRWLAVLYIAADMIGLMGSRTAVAHGAHLGGAAFALLYWSQKWRISQWWSRVSWSMPERKPRVRIYQPQAEEDLESEVDRILAKISSEGEASLTREERETLKAASRRARGRMGRD